MSTYKNSNFAPAPLAPATAWRHAAPWALGALVLALAGCGGGGGGGSNAGGIGNGSGNPPATSLNTVKPDAPTYRVGGTVGGLAGRGLVLQNNAGDDLAVAASGNFAFAGALGTGAAYSVSVKTQPADPAQVCTVNAGTGTVASADVGNVAVTCATSSFLVGGSVTGLQGAGLAIQNNAGDDIAVGADGQFRFASAVASGANYTVTVKSQPTAPTQTCSVNKGSGKVVNAAIDDVAIVCSTNSYPVSGSVTGLLGSGLVLTNNGEDLPVSGAGTIAFTQPVASGADYTVTVKTQPSQPTQTCTVSDGHGTIVDGGVGNVSVACTTNSYKVRVTLTGLDGVGLVLQNNAGDDLALEQDGTQTFSQEVASGQAYAVTVKTQPTLVTQECTVSNGSGSIGGADVTDVAVACQSLVPNFAYLAVQGAASSGKILPYAIDATGTLAALDASFAGSTPFAPTSLAIAATGRFAYATSLSSGNINQYNIGTNGAMTPMAVAAVGAGTAPTALALDPKGRFAYALNALQSLSVLAINGDGSLGPVKRASVGLLPTSYAVEATGRFVYVANAGTKITTFEVQADGSLTKRSTLDARTGVLGMAMDPAGRHLYVVTGNPVTNGPYAIRSYAIAANGDLSAAGSASIGTSPSTQVYAHPSGRFVYLTMGNGVVRTFAVGAAGALQAQGDSDALGTPINGATLDAAGRFMLVSTAKGAFTYAIDHASGTPGAPLATTAPSTVFTSAAFGR